MASKKKSGAGAKRAAAGQENGWNGATRFNAIAPVFGRILQIQEEAALASNAPGAVGSYTLSATANREIQEAVAAAAEVSGASEDQIRSWVDSFSSLGRPGLMSSIPISAAECCANLNGTFDLLSRFSGGVEVPARGRIYGDMNPKKGTGTQLVTMWTEENHSPRGRGNDTIFLICLIDLKFTQNGPYEVIGTSRGKVFGNAQGYEKGVETRDEFILVRKAHNEAMVGAPARSETSASDSGELFQNQARLVEVSGDPGIIKYKMWGVPATDTHPATLDTVDTYAVMNTRRPLVGGWEPIRDYFNRVTRGAAGGRAAAKGGEAALFTSPGNRQALRSACELPPIPPTLRRG